ncbi:unnamed protein product [Sphenostylis stenocarpa]|uniref:Uncharacterized protein n=1 Tax=Sphenostylis stenocarpa TaxID=92480 RepID=A0AA86SCS1_9FABA|nr:unnamed protein product [Sphenostylis stenocarpa]
MAQKMDPKWRFLKLFILIILCTLLIGLLIFIFLYFFLHKDKPCDVTIVTVATLTQFHYLSNSNTLYYNLVLNLTISNIAYGYDFIEAGAFYQGLMFASSIVKTYSDDDFNKLNAVFQGHQQGLSLSTDQISQDNGVYLIRPQA